jgi:ribosomal protein S20
MPKLPDATALDRPVPQPRRSVTTDQSGQIMGQAIEGAGNTLIRLSEQRQERQDRTGYAAARSSLLQADVAARRELENDNDFATHEARYREKLGQARQDATKLVRGRTDRALFELDTAADLERGVSEIRGQARRMEVDTSRASLNDTLQKNRTAALEAKDEGTRSALIQSTQEAITGAAERGFISAQEAVDQRQRWTADYGEGHLDIQSLPDRIKILSNPKGTPADYIAPDRRAVLLKAAQNELKAEQARAQTEARAILGDQLTDIAAAAQAGVPVPVKTVPSKASLQLAFGEREGAQRYESARKLANMSVEIASLHGLPGEELIAQAEAYRPKQVEGAAEQGQLYGVVGRAVSGILNERQQDPAGYLLTHSPTVQQAWGAFQGDPEKAPAYLSAVRAEKERMGISGADILPNAYVQGIADELNTAQTAEQLATRVESEVARWGEAWPTVQGQLANKVSDLTLVMGSGIPRSASVALASTMKLKDTELKAMLPVSTKWTDVEESVATQFADFQRSLPPEAARTWNAVKDSAMRLSVKYMNDGADRNDAVARAYRDLVESQYTLTEYRGTTIRIPSNLDVQAVEIGVNQALEAFEPAHGSIVVPPGSALTAEEYQATWSQYIRDNGYWVTRPDAKGVRLYADGGPVVGESGPVDLSWTQLQDKGMAQRATAEWASVERQRKEALKRQEMR